MKNYLDKGCKMLFKNDIRGCDGWGCGRFGSSRGDRRHMGLDISCAAKQEVFSAVSGVVSKIGYAYRQDIRELKHFRYIEITINENIKMRIFYIEPGVKLKELVEKGKLLGRQQKLGDVYPDITEHIHIEHLIGKNRVDPMKFLDEMC